VTAQGEAQMPIITVPKVLREKLGDEGVEALVALINTADSQTMSNVLALAEEKFERRLSEEATKLSAHITELESRLNQRIGEEVAKLNHHISEVATRLDARITEEVARLDARITEEVARLNVRLTEEVARLDARIAGEAAQLNQRITEVKADVIRWMFLFWVGQIGALVGILAVVFK
jgi:uncharacterized protein YicC (UPF0701 family)